MRLDEETSNRESLPNFPDPATKAEFEELFFRRDWIESYVDAASKYIDARLCVSQETIIEAADDPEFNCFKDLASFFSMILWRAFDDSQDLCV